ncbi:hypothetical protein D9M68_235570 [compost metagenome]
MPEVPWPLCAACGSDTGNGVFSTAQATVWSAALLRLRACWSDLGTSFHMAAGKRFQTSANFSPQKPVQVMPVSSMNSSSSEPQKPVTACRSRQNRRPRLARRGQNTPRMDWPRGHQR